jgi:hypothetical protein
MTRVCLIRFPEIALTVSFAPKIVLSFRVGMISPVDC